MLPEARRFRLVLAGRIAGLALFCIWGAAAHLVAAPAYGDVTKRPHFDRAVITLERPAVAPLAFTVELALSEHQHKHGLMFAAPLAPMTGMLFVFDQAAPRRFWMKNTPISLDILFFDADGALLSLAPKAQPFSEDIIHSNGAARYVLEIAGGAVAMFGIGPGARLALDPHGHIFTAAPQEK